MTSPSLRILLVEDHLDTATVLGRLLRNSGFETVHAATKSEALALAEKETAGFDLVVSDLGLPDGSGLDLMHVLSTKYGMRGIALTGFGMEADHARTAEAGFGRHLTKPLKVATLLTAISEMTTVAV